MWVEVNFEEAERMKLHFLLVKVERCLVENRT